MSDAASRPFTRHEKSVLRAYLGRGATGVGERIFGAIMLFCLLTITMTGLWQFFRNKYGLSQHFENPLVIAVIIIAFSFAMILYTRSGKNRSEMGRLFHEDLRNGSASVYAFAAKDAVRVEEFEDGGQAVYVDIGGGKVLFLMGPYLSEMMTMKHFPSRYFEVAYAPQSRLVLDIISKGEYLAPSVTLPAFSESDFASDRIPDDGAILDMDFAALRPKTGGSR